MIKIIEGNLFDSKANFIVHQVNCKGVMESEIAAQVANKYPHVEIEYRKYLRYCKKNKIKPLGTVQYVPSEVWALPMVDTMKNDNVIDYDEHYQYVVNLFGQHDYGLESVHTDLKAMTKAFVDIKEKAQVINAAITMPYMIGSDGGKAKWDDVYYIIREVFDGSGVDVEIRKCNKKQ